MRRVEFLIAILKLFGSISGDNVNVIQVDTIVSKNNCELKSSQSCTSFFIFFSSCQTSYYQYCYVTYATAQVEKKICKDGWADLPSCLTPICTNCAPGQVCTAPNTCQCLKTGGACTNVACSSLITCYPGTCINGVCSCPPTFSGVDCEITKETPGIKTFEVKLLSTNSVLGPFVSNPVGRSDNPTLWVNGDGITSMVLSAGLEFTSNFPFPNVAFVSYPPAYGIAEAGFQINGITSFLCLFSADNPKTYGSCVSQPSLASLGLLLTHGLSFTLSAYAKIGGFKIGSKAPNEPNSGFPRKNFDGNTVNRSVSFKVDNMAPTHCLSDPTADCPSFPISMLDDITANPSISAEIQRWTDSDSGLKLYYIEVFLLAPGGSGQLEKTQTPVFVKSQKAEETLVAFNLQIPGVYSLELTVFDQANNSVKARNVFIYTGDAKLHTDPTKPITFVNLVSNVPNVWWLNDGNILKTKYLTLSWDGHFISDARFSDTWGNPVKPLESGIDDLPNYRNRYGLRNISRFSGLPNGILGYRVSYYVDPVDGGAASNFPNFQAYPPSVTSVQLNYTALPDGGTLAVELTCLDAAGGLMKEHLFVSVDTSPPKVSNSSFLPNNPDIYSSSVQFWVEEKNSGIKEIQFNLYDGINSNPFKSGTVQPKTRDKPNTNNKRRKREVIQNECKPSDSNCYCSPLSGCYDYIQTVTVDHCWFDRMNVESVTMKINVVNNAGLIYSGADTKLTGLKELHCRPPNTLSPGQIAAIVICVLILIFLLALILTLLIRIYLLKKPVPPPMLKMRDRINAMRSEPKSSINDLYTTSDGPVGGKDGYDDDDVKRREIAENSREPHRYERLSYEYMDRSGISAANVAAAAADASPVADIPKDTLKIEGEISRGKMMVIQKATMNGEGGKKILIAIKCLKNGASAKEKEFMTEKAEFMRKLNPHPNIIKCIGISQGPFGKMIIMEHCDISLTKWLSDIRQVTPEIIDEMTSYGLNIAEGVQHLHENDVVHKRLSAKNVLLVKTFNQNVAKLIGFGPSFQGDKKASVPVKWLSPETLETINDPSPTYNKQTDAWSYGITLWEIYTRAKTQPYPNHSGREARKVIIIGEKMLRPEECPPAIFEKVMSKCWETEPNDRPSFHDIIQDIKEFSQDESSRQPGYYSATGEISVRT